MKKVLVDSAFFLCHKLVEIRKKNGESLKKV